MNTAATATQTPADESDHGLRRILAELGAKLGFQSTPTQADTIDGVNRVPAWGDGPLCCALVPAVRTLGELRPVAATLQLDGDWTPFAAGGWVRMVEGPYAGTRRTMQVKHLILIVTVTHRASAMQISGKHPKSEAGRYRQLELSATALVDLDKHPGANCESARAVLARLLALPFDWTLGADALKTNAAAIEPAVQAAWQLEVSKIIRRESAAAKAWARALAGLDWGKAKRHRAQELQTAVRARFFWRGR